MSRKLVVLMIEIEQPEGVSARKLVLETAKHNVITAYTAHTGLGLLDRFPNVDAVVIHSGMTDISCEEIIQRVKSKLPSMPVVVLSPQGPAANYKSADFVVDSYIPNDILELLAKKLGADRSVEPV
jgi:DNA-binding NtrC family response regulator